jgi:hypothetical protein
MLVIFLKVLQKNATGVLAEGQSLAMTGEWLIFKAKPSPV